MKRIVSKGENRPRVSSDNLMQNDFSYVIRALYIPTAAHPQVTAMYFA